MKVKSSGNPLQRTFYAREPVTVARALIGKHIVRIIDEQRLIGRIVEAEAYRGTGDAASHARPGQTRRNYPMFGPPGHAYVYFIYGMHWMFNVVAHPEETPGAILIRAIEPVVGIEVMRQLRGGQPDRSLTNGPARLAQALAIDRSLNDLDLCTDPALYIATGSLREGESIVAGPRVRVPGGEVAQGRPWRFWLKDNPWISN